VVVLLLLLLLGSACSEKSDRSISFIEHGVDESAGGVPCYIVETPAATYYLEKEDLHTIIT